MADNAEWTDKHTRIVCELFAEQVAAGNSPSTHLNIPGYALVIAKFEEKTGIKYTKRQFKNKWDKLKNDYNIWKKLTTKETGLGWDPEKKTIKTTAQRWKELKKISSSENESEVSDVSDEEYECDVQIMQLQQDILGHLAATAIIVEKYHSTYLDKNEARTSRLSGMGWVIETLNTSGESHHMFRMNATIFQSLHDLLVTSYNLKSTTHMSSIEALTIFLYICGGSESNRRAQNWFKHSGKTISRKFDEVLECVVKMSSDIVQPKDPNFSTVHSRITNDRRMWPHFKDCIGALDGTHILATVPLEDQIRYIGRSGKTTQNVMAICDFDMRFTYASIGQPGAIHDTSVLYHALNVDKDIFPHLPQGKYYLIDAGYPNRPGYLATYKGQRYHIPEFRRGDAPSGEKEKFNKVHSSGRNIIERTLGVWKMKWRILLKMPSFPLSKQKMIVAATMGLHNFIRDHASPDKHFCRFERNPNYVPTIPSRYTKYVISQDASDVSTSQSSDRAMDRFRYDLAKAIDESW